MDTSIKTTLTVVSVVSATIGLLSSMFPILGDVLKAGSITFAFLYAAQAAIIGEVRRDTIKAILQITFILSGFVATFTAMDLFCQIVSSGI